jgi:hypothetical protein
MYQPDASAHWWQVWNFVFRQTKKKFSFSKIQLKIQGQVTMIFNYFCITVIVLNSVEGSVSLSPYPETQKHGDGYIIGNVKSHKSS